MLKTDQAGTKPSAMADTADSTRKMVVLTRESRFFVPENGSPIATRSVSKTGSPLKVREGCIRNLEKSFPDELDGNSTDGSHGGLEKKPSSWSFQGFCLFGICALLLVLLCLLLVYGRRDVSSPLFHSTVVAGLAGTLGYAIACAQTKLN